MDSKLTSADYSPEDEEVPVCQASVPEHDAGERLDVVMARLWPAHSRSRLQGWIRAGRVHVDAHPASDPKQRLRGGEVLLLEPEADPLTQAFQPEPVEFPVIHEDGALLVIDKPAGLVVHPGSGNWSGTLLNGLLHRWPELARLPRAGIVHRLDKDTSGLMVVARSLPAQTDLVRQLQARTVKRRYMAVASGHLAGTGQVDAPIGRHPTQRTRMAVVPGGKPALTHYEALEVLNGATRVECVLETGRTHQIRVHMAHIGHPLVGDPVYGARTTVPVFARQALHAWRLGLNHPVTGGAMLWSSALPADFEALLGALRAT